MARELIYLEWRDAVQGEGANDFPEHPKSALFKGYATLLEETETDLVVCLFADGDGFYFDRVAIPRQHVEKLRRVKEVRFEDGERAGTVRDS